MNRKETTEFLKKLLVSSRLSTGRKYWASEVSIDYGTKDVRRIDFLQFEPAGVIHQSDIEKGIFTCYEVKSCREDVYSGHGLNFIGEKNYIVTTMGCYKTIQPDIISGKLREHILDCSPKSSTHFGVLVPVPWTRETEDEYENPTSLEKDTTWTLKVIYPCHQRGRDRSTVELLFCMLRSGQEKM